MENELTPDDQTASDPGPAGAGRQNLIRRVEWIVGVAASAVALFLFVVRATHAGALWRDEADSVQWAQMPLQEMAESVPFSSFPILFPLSLRAYITLFGASDISLRSFGVAVGILLLAVAWLSMRKLTGRAPLLLPAMIGLNANFLIAGMSPRGYGLGSLALLVAFVCNARLLLNPTFPTLISVFVADLASAQLLFLNVPLVFAVTVAAMAVFLIRREMKWVWLLAGVLIVCSLSEFFYLLQFRSSLSGWWKIIQVPVTFGLAWHYFFVCLGVISSGVSNTWLGLISMAVMGAVWRFATIRNDQRARERDLSFFGILLIPFAMIATFAFVQVLQCSPEQRFFLALTILLAATADLLWANFPFLLRVARISLVTLATMTLPFSLWGFIIQAESNAEPVAKTVEHNAEPGDLIVVNPWTYGVSFNWYYHGPAHWVTVPEIDDHRVHRCDLLLEKMVSVSPLADLDQEIATTLKSGNRVWFIGQAELPPPGESPLQVSPAPDPRFGWQGFSYRKAWSQEITLFLWQHVREIDLVDTRTDQLVNERENLFLYKLEGWKE